MFRIERQIVPVCTEKIITLYLLQVKFELENLSATFIDAKISQLQKNGKYMYFNYCTLSKRKCGTAVDN